LILTSRSQKGRVVAEFGLSDAELVEAATVISKAMPGIYTARQLYGEPRWTAKESPTKFGERLKATIEAGHLAGIEIYPDKTGSNAIRYVVGGG
jgi:hypothetical protein